MTVFKKILWWTFIIGGSGFVLYILGCVIYFFFILSQFDSSSYKDLTENYDAKTKEIFELKSYLNSVVPADKSVFIEFDEDDSLPIFHVTVDGKRDDNWDVKINSGKADTLLRKLGWTQEILMTLKGKLEKANCISVANGNPFQIGFHRSGMGEYFYNLFDKPISDSLKSTYNDSCNYIIYKENVVLEWGGGAVGPQCFPDL